MGNYYAFATTELLLAMSEKKQKAVYDFIATFNFKKGERTEEPPTHRTEPSPYEANDTMRMLGKQYIFRYMDNDEVRKGINDIVEARKYNINAVYDLITDIFIFGFITGKKGERARKKATTQPTK